MDKKRERSLEDIEEIQLECTLLSRDLDDLTNHYLREKHGLHERYNNRPASYYFEAQDCDPKNPDSIIHKIGELLLDYAGPKTKELAENNPLKILVLALRNIGSNVETMTEDLLHKKDYAGTPLQSTSYRKLSMIGYEAVHVLEEYLQDIPEILEHKRQAKQKEQKPPSPLTRRPRDITLEPDEIKGPKQRPQPDFSMLEQVQGQTIAPDKQVQQNLQAQGIQPAFQTGQEVTTKGGLILPYGKTKDIDTGQEASEHIAEPEQRQIIQTAEPEPSGDRRSFAGTRIESEIDDKGKKALVVESDLSGPDKKALKIKTSSTTAAIERPGPKTPMIVTPTGKQMIDGPVSRPAQPELTTTQTRETDYTYEEKSDEQPSTSYKYASSSSEQENTSYYVDPGSSNFEQNIQAEKLAAPETLAPIASPVETPAVEIQAQDLDSKIDSPSVPTPELNIPEVPTIQLVDDPPGPDTGLFGPDDRPLTKVTDLPDIPDISGPKDWKK